MKKLVSMMLALLMLSSFASAEAPYEVKVSSPSGAPGLVLATLAAQSPEQYTYVAADTIPAEFAKDEADFIIAPINVGAKLYKAGKSTYRLAAVVTWGNLYFASQREGFAAEDMNGAEVTLFGENTINASVALYALKENGIEPANVEYMASAFETQSLLLSNPDAIVLTAEPALTAAALTAASMKNSTVQAVSLNSLYEKAAGYDGYAQAGLFVRAQTISEQPEAVREFLTRAQEAAAQCETDVAQVAAAAVALELMPNQKVAEQAIPRCAIRFVAASEARPQVERTAQVDLSQFGGALPEDSFYYAP